MLFEQEKPVMRASILAMIKVGVVALVARRLTVRQTTIGAKDQVLTAGVRTRNGNATAAQWELWFLKRLRYYCWERA